MNIDDIILSIIDGKDINDVFADLDEAVTDLTRIQGAKVNPLSRLFKRFKAGAPSFIRKAHGLSKEDSETQANYNKRAAALYDELKFYTPHIHDYCKMLVKQDWMVWRDGNKTGGYWSIGSPQDIRKKEYNDRSFLCDRLSDIFLEYSEAPDGGFYTIRAVDNWILYTIVTSKQCAELVASSRKNAEGWLQAWAYYSYRKDIFNRNRNTREQIIDFIRNRQKYLRKVK